MCRRSCRRRRWRSGFGTGITQVDACAVNEAWQTNVPRRSPATRSRRSTCWSARSCGRWPTRSRQTTQDAVASNGLSLNANYDVTSAQVLAAIGRPLPGGAATQSVNIVLPGEVYGPRINSVDFRFAKVLRFGAHADQRRARPLQPVQREHGNGVQPGLRRRCRRGCGRRRS